jgi:uncharacterized protein YjbJ (UPF0337 family)
VGNYDEAKGRVKEAGGDLTGDKSLKRRGQVDRAVGATKQAIDRVGDKLKDVAAGKDDRG